MSYQGYDELIRGANAELQGEYGNVPIGAKVDPPRTQTHCRECNAPFNEMSAKCEEASKYMFFNKEVALAFRRRRNHNGDGIQCAACFVKEFIDAEKTVRARIQNTIELHPALSSTQIHRQSPMSCLQDDIVEELACT